MAWGGARYSDPIDLNTPDAGADIQLYFFGGLIEVFAQVTTIGLAKFLQINAGKKALSNFQLDPEVTREFDLDSSDPNFDLDLPRGFPFARKVNYCGAYSASKLELLATKVTQTGDLERPHTILDSHAATDDRIGRQHRQLSFANTRLKIQLAQFQSAEIDNVLADTGLDVNLQIGVGIQSDVEPRLSGMESNPQLRGES